MSDLVVWIHGDGLSPTNPALAAYQGAPAIFVFDEALIASSQVSLKRIVFMYECLLEMPVVIRKGDVGEQITRFAEEHGARRMVTTPSPSPRFKSICDQLQQKFKLEIVEGEPFLDYSGKLDLARFSRYWATAKEQLFE
jgi:hypothetical protein